MRVSPALLTFVMIAAIAVGIAVILRPGGLPAPHYLPSRPMSTGGPSFAALGPTGSSSIQLDPSREAGALDPVASPEAPPGPCSNSSMTREFAPMSFAGIARSSKAVVLVTVLDVGAAQWNTSDGSPPARPHPDPTDVIRLARVRVDELLAGSLSSDIVAFPGGTIGCWSFLMDETPSELRLGDRYVLIVREGGLDVALPGVSLVSRTWTFAGGRVATPLAGPMTLAELRAHVREPASSTP